MCLMAVNADSIGWSRVELVEHASAHHREQGVVTIERLQPSNGALRLENRIGLELIAVPTNQRRQCVGMDLDNAGVGVNLLQVEPDVAALVDERPVGRQVVATVARGAD